MPADPSDGQGRSFRIKCLVRDGANNASIQYGIVGAANGNGVVPLAVGEELDRDGTFGWVSVINTTASISTPVVTQLKNPVDYATTSALPAYTRVGNVLTANANGALPNQDGQTPQVNDRILVKDQAASHADHGIYTITAVGSGGAPWVFTRAADWDSSGDFVPGTGMIVRLGATQKGQLWYLATGNPITLNTTALQFLLSASGFSLNLVTLSGPVLSDGDETLRISDGNIRIVSSDFSALRTKAIDLYGATNGDVIKVVVAASQTYGINFTNGTSSLPGDLGLTWGSRYNWFVPPGKMVYLVWKFDQQDDSTPGNWRLDCKEFLGAA